MAGPGRDAPVGGQAVLEGVMMRGVRTWSVAVRAPTAEQLERGERMIPEGEIAVRSFAFTSALRRHRVLRLPLLRGVVALGGSMAIGLRALNISANAQLAPTERKDGEGEASALSGAAWAGALTISFAFAVGLFFLAPVGLVSLIKSQLHSSTLFWPIGANTKMATIITIRRKLVPLIAGISFEIIKLAARHRDRAWVRAAMAPGMALQRLTTREPDHRQLAVAIAALRAVLDVEERDELTGADLVGLEVVA